MVEPLAVGMHAANKAQIKPGDVAVVIGAGPIGMVTLLSALAGGCSHVIIADVQQPKLDLAASLGPVTPVNVAKESLTDVVMNMTDGWGADIVFEASGNAKAASNVFERFVRPVAWSSSVYRISRSHLTFPLLRSKKRASRMCSAMPMFIRERLR